MEARRVDSFKNHTSRYMKRVHCPQCRARLFDICSERLEYTAILDQENGETPIDLSFKCPKCKMFVGIVFGRNNILVE